jgi:hypothetical protein
MHCAILDAKTHNGDGLTSLDAQRNGLLLNHGVQSQ